MKDNSANYRKLSVREYYEAKLIDVIDGTLSATEIEVLGKELVEFADLKAVYDEILLDNEEFKPINQLINADSSPAIPSRTLKKIELAMDQELYWLQSIPKVKSMIYRVILPAMAASLFMFFQFGTEYVTPISVDVAVTDLSGQAELQEFQMVMNDYAGVEEINVLIDEFGDNTNPSGSN